MAQPSDATGPPSLPDALEEALFDAFDFSCKLSGRAALYARIAEAEGRLRDAQLFHGIAESALTHAWGHLERLGAAGDTDDNGEEVLEVLHEAALEGFDRAAELSREADVEELAEWFDRVSDALILEADLLEETLNREAGVSSLANGETPVEWWYPKSS